MRSTPNAADGSDKPAQMQSRGLIDEKDDVHNTLQTHIRLEREMGQRLISFAEHVTANERHAARYKRRC